MVRHWRVRRRRASRKNGRPGASAAADHDAPRSGSNRWERPGTAAGREHRERGDVTVSSRRQQPRPQQRRPDRRAPSKPALALRHQNAGRGGSRGNQPARGARDRPRLVRESFIARAHDRRRAGVTTKAVTARARKRDAEVDRENQGVPRAADRPRQARAESVRPWDRADAASRPTRTPNARRARCRATARREEEATTGVEIAERSELLTQIVEPAVGAAAIAWPVRHSLLGDERGELEGGPPSRRTAPAPSAVAHSSAASCA